MTDNYTEAVDRLLEAVDRALPFFVARGETSYARRGELRAAADHVRATARGIETTLAGSMRERRQAIGPDVAEPITVPDVELVPVSDAVLREVKSWGEGEPRRACTCGRADGQHVTGCPAKERVPLAATRDPADRCRCPKSMTNRNRHRPGCVMYAGEGP